MKKIFFSFWFKLFGWKIKGKKAELKKYVVIVAPHTSNMDFLVGMAAKSILRLKSDFLAKKSLFRIPLFGAFLRSVGGHPVDRTKKMNMVDQVVRLFERNDELVMTVTPEGTRSYNSNWKTGFYRIAHQAGVPIVMVGFDYEHKVVEFREPFYTTGNVDEDMEYFKAYFRTLKGKHPEKGVR